MTRERILTVAYRTLRKQGVASLSLRQVAGKIGVTPMAIYRHFRNKDDLVEALVASGFARWETYLAEAVRAEDAWARIERAFLAYAEFALAEPRLFELMFMTPRSRVPRAPQSLSATPSPSFSVVINSFAEALGPKNATDTLLLSWATAHGLICLHFSGRFGFDAKLFRTEYARVVGRLLTLLQD